MSIRLNLSLLTILAAFSATIPGCGDDADGDPDTGGEAGDGDTGTGGKATSTGGRASSSDAGSTGEDAGAPGTGGKSSTGGKSGSGGISSDAGGPSVDAGAPGEAGSTGTGGSSTGGASSTGGKSGGEGGAPSGGDCAVPQCLIDLLTGCEPEGECTQTSNLDPLNPPANLDDITYAICWENGVKAGMEGFSGDTVSLEFQKDGDVCYTTEMSLSTSVDTTDIVYKDSSGNIVARETIDSESNTMTVTCEDSGESVTYSPDDCGDDEPTGEAPDTSECAMTSTCTLD